MPPFIRGTDHYWRDWTNVNNNEYVGIDFPAAQASGSRFSWFKACSGMTDTLHYQAVKAEADQHGHASGPYVWLFSAKTVSINGQADYWFERLKDSPVIAIDFENYLAQDYPTASDLWGAISRLRANGYKGKIGVYTSFNYWTGYSNADPKWLEMVDFLWLADPDSEPKIPAPFTRFDFWQDSWRGDPVTWGIRNNKEAVDLDLFNGTEDELKKFFNAGEIIPPPPQGEPMYQVTPVAGKTYVNVRSNHTVTSADIGDLPAGQIAKGDQLWTSGTAEKWLHITELNGAPKEGWIAVITSGVKFTELTEIIPPSANPIAEVKFTAPDGKVYFNTVELKPQ